MVLVENKTRSVAGKTKIEHKNDSRVSLDDKMTNVIPCIAAVGLGDKMEGQY
jgi:hypothetical protein